MQLDPQQLKEIFDQTDIRKVPLTGIVAGYHTLPFTLVGPNDDSEAGEGTGGSLKLTGKITVSPKLILSVSREDERFAEIFREDEPFMDKSITGRVFSFSTAFRNKNLKVRNEYLNVEELGESAGQVIETVLNDMARAEIINMGVIWCPVPRFYPISLERFILSVLERELR